MSSSMDKRWMYTRRKNGYMNEEYIDGVVNFLDFAFGNGDGVGSKIVNGETVLVIRCPCKKCKLQSFEPREIVQKHLWDRGFMSNYTNWFAHGERLIPQHVVESSEHVGECSNQIDDVDEVDGCTQMVLDNMHVTDTSSTWEQQDPNPSTKGFYDMLENADQPLWDGCQDFSKLEAATRVLNWKAECNVPEATYNRILRLIKQMLPKPEQLVGSLYETKKMLKDLSLPAEKIHACKNHCMLYYKENAGRTRCVVCKEPRYKTTRRGQVPNFVLHYLPIAPRLQRLYMAKKMAEQMTWHHDHPTKAGEMEHPSDGKAWKHFDKMDPEFAGEIRNVRLVLCTDGFSPNNTNSNPYSLWPVFLTNYNLPPWMSLEECYIHLELVIPGRKSPGQNIDVFLRPLIDELKMLYVEGVQTYDTFHKNNFTMRAILLWTVSDFPAYAMLSGWSTHGRLACPYCINKVGSFQLQHGGKACWFDCHRKFLPESHTFRRDKTRFRARLAERLAKPPMLTGDNIWGKVCRLPTVYEGVPYNKKNRKIAGFGTTHNWVKKSIFWELPYWHTLLIRHNLDVMHIEKNAFENLFHTIMDTSKTKYNIKARRDIPLYCNRPELHIVEQEGTILKSKASYTLSRVQLQKVCEWLKNLRFPDGYASNIGECVNLGDCSFYGFKSHDCHVFMQRLLPISIKGMVPNSVWDPVMELSTFFRTICSRMLHINDLEKLQESIVETICKLERIFPPAFFDSMEHLVIHLAHEAILGGPVQYRWMYLNKRRLGSLKRTVRNKAHIEGCIVEAYLLNELSTYCALYFDDSVETHLNRVPRNFAPNIPNSLKTDSRLSIFKVPAKRLFENGGKPKILSPEDTQKAQTYVLFNCVEVRPFLQAIDMEIRHMTPYIDEGTLNKRREIEFAEWFKNRIIYESDSSTKNLKGLAAGPLLWVWSHCGYIVNGYKFHTLEYAKGRVTDNSGVCVKGSCYNEDESDYYGQLEDVLEMEYSGVGRCVVVLFRCRWFDTVDGVRVDKHNLINIKHRSRLRSYDPFVLASQASQVYYTPYPSREMKDWWAVVKTKPRGIYEVKELATEIADSDNGVGERFFQENERLPCPTSPNTEELNQPLSLATEQTYTEVVVDNGANWHLEDSDDEEDEFDGEESDDDEEDDDELSLSDNSSDDY